MTKFLMLMLLLSPALMAFELPQAKGKTRVEISRVDTGYNDSGEALIYEEGSWFELHRSSHTPIILQHPKGNLLIDTGLSENVDEQFQEMPFWAKPFFKYEKLTPLRQVATPQKIKIDSILMTHMHWDHASAIEEFPEANIYLDKKEYNFINSKERSEHAFLEVQFDDPSIKWKMIPYQEKSFGPFKKHFDFYGDGSIVIVPLYGHTPGSIGIIVNSQDGKRIMFIGDSVWHRHQIPTNTKKNAIASCLVDHDKELTTKTIDLLHKVSKANPDIVMIPAHDAKALAVIPVFQ